MTLQNGTFEQLATKFTTLLKLVLVCLCLCFLCGKYLYMPISSVVHITMLTNKKKLFLKHIFEKPHEKSHEKIFKSKATLVHALAQLRDFQGCFFMVLEVFSRSSKLNS